MNSIISTKNIVTTKTHDDLIFIDQHKIKFDEIWSEFIEYNNFSHSRNKLYIRNNQFLRKMGAFSRKWDSVSVRLFDPSVDSQTCYDLRWHFDGSRNLQPRWYDMIYWTDGDDWESLGTLFTKKSYSYEEQPVTNELSHNINLKLNELGELGTPIPPETLVRYNSHYIHRGRKYTGKSRRILLRFNS